MIALVHDTFRTASSGLITRVDLARRLLTRQSISVRLADRLPVVALCIVTCAILVPFLLVRDVPLVDWPNHLARMHVLGATAHDVIRQTYAPHWALMPDLGCDLIYYVLSGFAGPDTVLRLCLVGSVLVLVGAIWSIHVLCFGRTGYGVAASPLLITGLSVYMGYLNYVLSIAIAFVGLAFYTRWKDALSPIRVVALAVVATLCWFAHIAGFGTFGLMLAILLAAERTAYGPDRMRTATVALRRIVVLLTVFGPGLVLSCLAEKQIASPQMHYHEAMKLRFLFAPWIATGSVADLGACLLCVAALLLALQQGGLRLSAILRPTVVALLLLVVVCPYQVGDAVDVDARLVLPLTALVLAGTECAPPIRPERHGLAILVLLMLVGLRWYGLLEVARENSREIATFRSFEARLPVGSALMVSRDVDEQQTCHPAKSVANPPLTHLASYAAIDRGIYNPLVFTGVGMQPLRTIKHPLAASLHAMSPSSFALLNAITEAGSVGQLSRNLPNDPHLADEAKDLSQSDTASSFRFWPAAYNAVLVLHRGCVRNLMPGYLKLIGSGDFFSLYTVTASPPLKTSLQ